MEQEAFVGIQPEAVLDSFVRKLAELRMEQETGERWEAVASSSRPKEEATA